MEIVGELATISEYFSSMATAIYAISGIELDPDQIDAVIEDAKRIIIAIRDFIADHESEEWSQNLDDFISDFNNFLETLRDFNVDFKDIGENYRTYFLKGFEIEVLETTIIDGFSTLLDALYAKKDRLFTIGTSFKDNFYDGFSKIKEEVSNIITSAIDNMDTAVTRILARSAGLSLGMQVADGFKQGTSDIGTSIQNQLNNLTAPNLSGAVRGFASGGYVGFPNSIGTDTIPAMLTYGEFIMRKRAVDKYGISFMDKVNKGDTLGMFRSLMPRFSTENFEYPSISTIVNNYTDNSNNSTSATVHVQTNNPSFITSHFERWT